MSYLKRFKRPTLDVKKSRVLSVRISDDLHQKFVDHCEDLGLSISEGVTYLLEREIRGVDDCLQMYDASKHLSDTVQQTAVSLLDKSKQTSYVCMTSSKPRRSSRFSILPYSIGNMTACPLCEVMTSRTNYARHIKSEHNYFGGTEQFINEHMDKVLEVLEREKEKQTT